MKYMQHLDSFYFTFTLPANPTEEKKDYDKRELAKVEAVQNHNRSKCNV